MVRKWKRLPAECFFRTRWVEACRFETLPQPISGTRATYGYPICKRVTLNCLKNRAPGWESRGPSQNKDVVLPSIGIPMLKIRRSPHTWERRSLYRDEAQVLTTRVYNNLLGLRLGQSWTWTLSSSYSSPATANNRRASSARARKLK